MTCIVILEVTAKKGAGMQLVETFRALLPDTRNKDGCQGVEVTTNLDNARQPRSGSALGNTQTLRELPRPAAAA
jgi:quinol monooxygenase YgiN